MLTKDEVERGISSEPVAVRECHFLDQKSFLHYWPELEKALDLEPKLWNGLFMKDEIYGRVLAGLIQVWVVSSQEVIHLVFMTQRYNAPNGLAVLQIFWAYGENFEPVAELVDMTLDRFAAKMECGQIEAFGRLGFLRFAKKNGYEVAYVNYTRPVRAVRGH